jgi:hypothetical protein
MADQDAGADAAARAAQRCREEGNAAFQAHRYEEALEAYTRGIALADDDAPLRSNRSAAHAATGDWAAALADADAAAALAPRWPKAHVRRGIALQGLATSEPLLLQDACAAFRAASEAAAAEGDAEAAAAHAKRSELARLRLFAHVRDDNDNDADAAKNLNAQLALADKLGDAAAAAEAAACMAEDLLSTPSLNARELLRLSQLCLARLRAYAASSPAANVAASLHYKTLSGLAHHTAGVAQLMLGDTRAALASLRAAVEGSVENMSELRAARGGKGFVAPVFNAYGAPRVTRARHEPTATRRRAAGPRRAPARPAPRRQGTPRRAPRARWRRRSAWPRPRRRLGGAREPQTAAAAAAATETSAARRETHAARRQDPSAALRGVSMARSHCLTRGKGGPPHAGTISALSPRKG